VWDHEEKAEFCREPDEEEEAAFRGTHQLLRGDEEMQMR